MGITESRIILGKLTVACFEADSNGLEDITGVLTDAEVSNDFHLSRCIQLIVMLTCGSLLSI